MFWLSGVMVPVCLTGCGGSLVHVLGCVPGVSHALCVYRVTPRVLESAKPYPSQGISGSPGF